MGKYPGSSADSSKKTHKIKTYLSHISCNIYPVIVRDMHTIKSLQRNLIIYKGSPRLHLKRQFIFIHCRSIHPSFLPVKIFRIQDTQSLRVDPSSLFIFMKALYIVVFKLLPVLRLCTVPPCLNEWGVSLAYELYLFKSLSKEEVRSLAFHLFDKIIVPLLF